ncbi:MAG: hypothetical protein WCW54_00230 [Candidatus Paceibacterota bacterium]
MKTIIVVFLLSITLWGCDKGSFGVDPILDPPKTYTVTYLEKLVTGEKSEVASAKAGDIKIFKLGKYPDCSPVSVAINGVFQALPLFDTYTVTVSSDLNVVVEYVSNDRLILMKTTPWFTEKIVYYDVNNNVLSTNDFRETPERLTDETYFYKTNYKTFHKGATDSFSGANWSLIGKVFNNGSEWEVLLLSEKNFVYQRPVTQQDGKVEYMRIFMYQK